MDAFSAGIAVPRVVSYIWLPVPQKFVHLLNVVLMLKDRVVYLGILVYWILLLVFSSLFIY